MWNNFVILIKDNKPWVEIQEPETSVLPKREIIPGGISKVAIPWLSKYFKFYRYTTPSKEGNAIKNAILFGI